MKAVEILERSVLSEKAALAPDESRLRPNIVGVYQDVLSRNWAMQICQPAAQLVGEERVQNLWYEIDSLSDTKILLEAVRAALVANVIVVSVHAADELPLNLYVWIDVWLPRRPSRFGTLTALIGIVESMETQSVRVFEYLEAVARRGEMNFIRQKRNWPGASLHPSIGLITK
jgi:hypothetical protein